MFAFLQKYVAHPKPAQSPGAPVNPPSDPHASAHWLSTHDAFISEADVSIERLLMPFRQAFIDVETAQGGERLVLRGDSGVRMNLAVDPQRQLLHLTAAFGLVEAAPLFEKLAAANRLNDKVVYLRASIVDDGTLTLDHQLNYDGGVSKAAVVSKIRRMDRIAYRALQEAFDESLLA